jgi:hypothetical protein
MPSDVANDVNTGCIFGLQNDGGEIARLKIQHICTFEGEK